MQEKANYTEWIDKLKSNNNIVHVISSYLSLTRRGGTYWACCPFHHEKTPSFAVNEPGQFYHCFGCGESGDVIKFVSKMEGCSYWEGAKILAERCGMELPTQIGDDDYFKQKKHLETLKEICRESAIFYNKIEDCVTKRWKKDK